MEYSDFVGLDDVAGRIKASTNSIGSFTHAHLFQGMYGTGKRSMAHIASRAMNCEGDVRPCGRCSSCQKYLSGTHPDHIVVRPEQNIIRVGAIRDLIDQLSIKPFEGGRHTVVIEEADKMNPQAQNTLLKTLEDPPGDTVLFLTCERTSKLLPTILSRVRLTRFHGVSNDDIISVLKSRNIGDEIDVSAVAEYAEGSVGKALMLLTDNDFWKLKTEIEDLVNKLFNAEISISEASSRLQRYKEDKEKVLDIMEHIGSLSIRKALSSSDRLKAARALTEAVIDARRMISSNVPWTSAADVMLMSAMGGARIV